MLEDSSFYHIYVREIFANFLYNAAITNPFDPNAPFLYPLKTSENHEAFFFFFFFFQGVEKGCLVNKWVNYVNTKSVTLVFNILLKI